MANCYRTTILLTLSGCPSILFLMLQFVTYMLAIASLGLVKGDISDPVFIDFLKLQPGNAIAMILMWGLLQGRELRRFND